MASARRAHDHTTRPPRPEGGTAILGQGSRTKWIQPHPRHHRLRRTVPLAGAPLRNPVTRTTVRGGGRMSKARWVNLVLGGWLFLSALLWQDSPSQSINMGMFGLVIAGLARLGGPLAFRLGTAAVAMWLFWSPFVLPAAGPWSVCNDCLLGMIAFGTPLCPSRFRLRLPLDS